MTFKLPGIYLLYGRISSVGELISTTENDDYMVTMDGIFFDKKGEKEDAEVALEVFEQGGADALVRRNGHFNIAIEKKKSGEIELISDVFSTKPWYFYSKEGGLAAAPSPLFFAQNNLEMSLNQQALFEMVVYNYSLSDVTLIDEISRNRPFYHYFIKNSVGSYLKNYDVTVSKIKKFDTKEKMGQEIFEIISRNMKAILANKKVKERKIQLALTGGFDSRHILGALMENSVPPISFRHVDIQGIDVPPVKIMSEKLGIPLKTTTVSALNFEAIVKEWLQRSGGFMNFHQTYLFDLLFDKRETEMVGFDGYLMDTLLGIRPLFSLNEDVPPSNAVLGKIYGSSKVHRSLFADYEKLFSKCRSSVEERGESLGGNNLEQGIMQQIACRSVKYTGSFFPLTGDDLLTFAPGACVDSLHFLLSASWSEGMYNKARYSMLEKYYPEMDSYPSIYGKRFSQIYKKNGAKDSYKLLGRERLQKFFKIGVVRNIGLLIPKATLGIFEPVKEGEHYWLRGIPELRKMMDSFVENSLLVKHSFIEKGSLEKMWKEHKRGAFHGWTMMNLFTAECLFRLLVKRQPIETIVDTFFDNN